MPLDHKSILVTGATGSFGNEFVRQILDKTDAERVALYSRDELKQYEMANRFASHPKFKRLRFLIGDVRDQARLNMAMDGIDIVVHAAALKHVPVAEYNPFEAVRTNVGGAENVIMTALANNVEKVVALSTDKAAAPLNLYGASKLVSDKYFVAANNISGKKRTRFAVVRYGNVVGSRGSVLPFFRMLKAKGAEALPITDARMTRFWITLPQGVDFVLSALETMQGGEIFIPKIPSVLVVDLAKAIAPELPLEFIGIRPGEKLHEVMITEDDARSTFDMGDYYVIAPTMPFFSLEPLENRGGRVVPEGFAYSSDGNSDFLEGQRLVDFLEMAEGLESKS